MDSEFDDRVLAIGDYGKRVYYKDISQYAQTLKGMVESRSLCFILCENKINDLLFYLAALKMDAVPFLLNADIEIESLNRLIDLYQPSLMLLPIGNEAANQLALQKARIELITTETVLYRFSWDEKKQIHPELALLLSTSGTTGSSKVIRLSKGNLQANAESIADYLEITQNDRPIMTLPMSYTYGLSIIHSHVLVGATIIMSSRSILENQFWKMVETYRVTSISGVPYTYEMIDRIGIKLEEYEDLKVLTQAGGHLSEHLQKKFARWANKFERKFYIMYGQTEATARMAYLPPQELLNRPGSIGIPIPNGRFEIEDGNSQRTGLEVKEGELVYFGPNVAMGYAQCADDLKLGDQWHGKLHTGDLARRDDDGYYYIVGRKSRFVKLYGYRISLDEVENDLDTHFPECAFACIGMDEPKVLTVFTTALDKTKDEIIDRIMKLTQLPFSVIKLKYVAAIPTNSAGKKDYKSLETGKFRNA